MSPQELNMSQQKHFFQNFMREDISASSHSHYQIVNQLDQSNNKDQVSFTKGPAANGVTRFIGMAKGGVLIPSASNSHRNNSLIIDQE